MLIKKIRLKNFKNFKDAELELGDMNVLVGANASGKSNFLQALKFLKDIQEHGLENAISLQGGMEYLRNINCGEDEAVEIEVEFFYDYQSSFFYDKYVDGKQIFDFEQETEIVIPSINYVLKIDNNSITEHIKSDFFFGLKDSDEIRRMTYCIVKNETQILDNIETFPKNTDFKISDNSIIRVATRKFVQELFGFYKRKSKSKPSLLQSNLKVLKDISQHLIYDFDLKKIKEPNSIKGKVDLEENGENIALVIKKILSDETKARQFSNLISDILPFIKSIETEKFYDKSLLFKIQEKGHTSPIPSSLLSDGTVSVTAILIALFFESNRLTIIEEPEYGIHPSLVSKLVDTFYEAAKNKQIIITTHSSEILKHIKLEDLRLISRDENGFSTVSKPAEKEMVREFLKNELGINDLFVQNLLDI